jgi:hypothetical protein
METYKSSFKALLDNLTKHVDGLEAENKNLRQALHDLLNEDDIKELPAYELLSMTYKPFLQGGPPAKPTAAGVPAYDPLHAPPSARFGSGTGSKTPSKANPRRPLVGVTSMAESLAQTDSALTLTLTETHYSSTMPDLDSCLLGAPPKTKVAVKVKDKVKDKAADTVKEVDTVKAVDKPREKKQEPLKISPKESETIYRVEIQGQNYLRYNTYLYDETTKLRVGDISDFKLGSNATTDVELTEIADYPGYYTGSEPTTEEGKSVYILLNGEIAQAVGTLSPEDELELWA